MKKSKLLVVGIGLLLVGALYAGQAQAAVSGSPHDFSGRGWGSTEICIFCHTPHNAATPQLAPLWNHTSTAVAAYTLYSSSTLNATLGQPAGTSKACLSCHDGTVAIDSYGARVGTTNITGSALVGTDLSNDHPVSFPYTALLATTDGGLVSPTSTSEVGGTGAKIPLFTSNLECASCHAVHDNASGNFLRQSNAASALCLRCHVK